MPQIDVHEEMLKVSALTQKIKALEEQARTAKQNVLDALTASGKKSMTITAREGVVLKATVVQATTLVYSEERLKNALDAKVWGKVTKQVLDKTLLEAAVTLGEIDENVVASCTDFKESAAYAKVSGVLSPEEARVVLDGTYSGGTTAPRVKPKPKRSIGKPVHG